MGRDLHNYIMYFKDNPIYEVVAFTNTQIPTLKHNKIPKIITEDKEIPIHPEEELSWLIKHYNINECVLSYSDLSAKELSDKASIVLAAGADFKLLGPNSTMIKSQKPLICINATRTGAGKGTIARYFLNILKKLNKNPTVIRHPMTYNRKLEKQIVQRFSNYNDLDKFETTLEEREEYQPYIDNGYIVYAGVNYKFILKKAEKESDFIVYEGGNNDISFFKPDLYVTVVDPLRIDGLFSYPGETNVRLADILIINKVNLVKNKDIYLLISEIKKINNKAQIIKGNSIISVDKPNLIRNKNVLVIEDSPTVTHGYLGYAAGYIAAKKFKARKIIDPRPYAVGSFKEIFKKYKHIKNVLPSTGYDKNELDDLEKTINNSKCDSVIFGTPCDLTKVIKINKPIVKVNYFFEEIGKPKLLKIIKNKFK